MLGLIFFLAAHLGFSLFLLMLHPGIDPFNIGIPLAVGVVFLLVERLCGLKMRKLRWPAFFYALLLAFFMVNALEFALDRRSVGALWTGVGAAAVFRLGREHYFSVFSYLPPPGAEDGGSCL